MPKKIKHIETKKTPIRVYLKLKTGGVLCVKATKITRINKNA